MTLPEKRWRMAVHVREMVEHRLAQGNAHAGHLTRAKEIEREAKQAYQEGRIVNALRREDRALLREAFAAAKRARG